MTRHFAYFIVVTFRNRMVRQVQRLRSPRYAIAAIVGLLYFYFIIGGRMPAGTDNSMGDVWVGFGRAAGPLILGLLTAWWWLWGGHRHGLVLTPAETHLLLPAPLTRGEVVRFKIMQAQPAILFSAAIGSLFLRGSGLPWPLRVLSVWVLLATLHQHQIAASLVHASADEHGRAGIRRNIIPITLFGIAFITLVWAVPGAVNDLRASGSPAGAYHQFVALMAEPGPYYVLTPFRILLAPTLAATAGGWLLPFAGACGALLLHYVWVARTDAAFEESAAQEGQRRDALVTAMRSGGMSRVQFARRDRTKQLAKAWLPLHSRGSNAYAIFWKNVLYSQRSIRSVRPMLIVLAAIVAVMSMSGEATGSGGMAVFGGLICLSIGGAISIVGPFTVRNDLRTDLKHIEQLRTYPVRSRDLVAAEIAAATATLTVPQLVLITAGLILLVVAGSLSAVECILVLFASIAALPFVNALGVSIQNTLALLYPSWVRLGEQDAGGIETVGQNMIVMVGTILLLVILALPPALAGALAGAPLAMVIGDSAVVVGACAAIAVVGAELALIVHWLGGLYDRTDPVAAGLLR